MKLKPVAWMSKQDTSRGRDTNYRRVEQDYQFSGGYGLRNPVGWEPLYLLDDKDVVILELYREQHGEALDVLAEAIKKTRVSAEKLGITVAEWEKKFGA